MPKTKQDAHVYELARRGAEARIQDLLNEVKLLTNLFPDLRRSVDRDELPISFILKRGAGRQAGKAATTAASDRPARQSGRRGWSAAQRKAAATRMKAYWAKRKAGKNA